MHSTYELSYSSVNRSYLYVGGKVIGPSEYPEKTIPVAICMFSCRVKLRQHMSSTGQLDIHVAWMYSDR